MKHLRIAASGLALLLAGCSPTVTANMSHAKMVTASGCSYLRITEVKLQPLGNLWSVPATVDGNYIGLMLDTGSSSTVIGKTAAEAMNLLAASSGGIEISSGLGGIYIAQPVRTKHFEVAGVDMADQTVGLRPLQPILDVMPPVLGLLGDDYLGAFDIELDLAHDRLGIYGSKHCDEGYLPWQPPYQMLPVTRDRADRVVLDVVLDGVPIHALIDTGASLTVLTYEGLQALKLPDSRFDKDRTSIAETSDGHDIALRRHHFQHLAIGPIAWPDPEIGVQTKEAISPAMLARFDRGDDPDPELILGTDFLKHYKIWISYGHNQVFLTPAG